jgi:DNA-binding transcriptional MerR regulator
MNMIDPTANIQLPPIPAKRYFTIGEVSELCGVKPHVLRYWEQEFTQLKPVKRRGNRRYYQHHEVLLIRRIRELLYEQGFTISGARHRLDDTDMKELNQIAKNGNGKAHTDAANVNMQLPLDSVNQAFDFNGIKTELRSILTLLRTV